MKVVGFNTFHDPDLNCSDKILVELLAVSEANSSTLSIRETIFSYLSKGHTLFKYVSPVYDIDGECIGPNIIYTDGIWVWPSYYLYYLRKHDATKIPVIFIDHIKLNNGICPAISKDEQHFIEYLLTKMLGIKIILKPEMQAKIESFVVKHGEKIECYASK